MCMFPKAFPTRTAYGFLIASVQIHAQPIAASFTSLLTITDDLSNHTKIPRCIISWSAHCLQYFNPVNFRGYSTYDYI